MFDKNKYSLLIIDIIIPSSDDNAGLIDILGNTKINFGIKFIKDIKKVNSTVPIIILSVLNDKEKFDLLTEIDPGIEFVWKYDSNGHHLFEIVRQVLCSE